jgi:hypothetical protein
MCAPSHVESPARQAEAAGLFGASCTDDGGTVHLLLPCKHADILQGQGMLYSPVTQVYWAVNCLNNNYGVRDLSPGLEAFPCRPCPKVRAVTCSNASTRKLTAV